ncbi:aminotransferase-like domain-containing protein [Actinoplanes derwentensis]|uniref:DNA-binding transcriptional regulator, MocR family, contains an aminotransferase domain n=1 Tax=Actinoplanes derwentensis TaxID=113562 RepID=A0A1H2BHS4_9ACTN|nr:PLP-dependent aminotransferase family protein [Actinoplanes derwentensis]GID87800.1 aminotransferase class I/II [Actinoplanes derwentensis]SDT57336.1 DNA-binding transcriptional regulator, MocR family, contains an aminotransferase domain [Actinoplanes derwentensis]
MIQFEGRAGILDLSWGHPRPDLLPVHEWAAASAHLDWRALTYGAAAGPDSLLESLGDPGRTFVTGGASHGLALVTQLLTNPGDVVLADAPTYHLAFPILRDRGVTLLQAPADTAAAVIRDIRASGRRVALLYLVPTFGNPTGRSLPEDQRRELIAVARQEGVTIVEDDTYRELNYDGPAPASLWELAGGAPVVRLGSFAKTVAPGLRLGWINAEPEIIGRLTRLGYVHSGGGVNHTTAVTMGTFRADGGYQRHVARVRSEYRAQRDVLVSALRADFATVESPAGGWFVWLRLPDGVTADALLPLAEERGVSFVPGTRFWADGPGGADRIRLSFSHLPADDLRRAAERLAAAVHRR